MSQFTQNQEKLIELIKKIERKPGTISASPEISDDFGRKLELKSQAIDGTKLNNEAKQLLLKLQEKDSSIEKTLKNEVMWYDIRSEVWKENPSLSALIALAYASVLIERTGRKDGHIINIAIDCYPKHHGSASILADTLIRTGIVNNSGGIIYWGIQNGGSIRNISEYQRAVTGENGNWIYCTMSHRKEDYVGAKFGMLGKVFCGEDLMKDLYSKLIKGDYPDICDINNPADYVVNVANLTENNINVCEDLIRARTGTKVEKEKLLEGLKIGFNMCGSPIGKNLVDILRSFGADIEVENSLLNPNFNTDNIIDPNEHESKPMEELKNKAKNDNRIYLALDPDGDRGTVIAQNNQGEVASLAGTELLILAAENLATYNPSKLPNECIFDMRTGVSALLLEDALNKMGYSIKLTASEPGYPFFMELMGKIESSVIAVENTNHEFLTPMTNPIWGAPKFYSRVQGGDDGAIFLIYILGLSKNLWDGRNPVQQLDFIREKYGLPKTIIKEFKPSLDKKDAHLKYDIAKEMCNIATEKFADKKDYEIDTMNSGVRITDKLAKAMVLVRYSNTGPAFTASGEAIDQIGSEKMFKIGGAIMNEAIKNVAKKVGEFNFNWNDFTKYQESF